MIFCLLCKIQGIVGDKLSWALEEHNQIPFQKHHNRYLSNCYRYIAFLSLPHNYFPQRLELSCSDGNWRVASLILLLLLIISYIEQAIE